MRNKKLLALLGSPRKNGSIARMLNLAVAEAKAIGWETETIDLYGLNLKFCNGCMQCRKTGICLLQDDLAVVRDKLMGCDMLVLGAPAYFANVPAPVKNLFDRLAGALMDDNSSLIPKPKLSKNQRYLLITACNTPAPFDRLAGQSSGAIRAMEEVFKTAGMKKQGKIVLAGSRNMQQLPDSIHKKIRRQIHA